MKLRQIAAAIMLFYASGFFAQKARWNRVKRIQTRWSQMRLKVLKPATVPQRPQ